jgi:hypothetical protein
MQLAILNVGKVTRGARRPGRVGTLAILIRFKLMC